MPNPDDILPKQAWTDFSGTDDWPNLIPGTGASASKRPKSRRNVDRNNDVAAADDAAVDDGDVYVNVKRSTTPVPKERKLLKSSKDNEGVEQSFEQNFDHLKDLVYESFVDDDDDDEGVASDDVTKSDQNLNDEITSVTQQQGEEEDLVKNVGQNSANLAARPPAQTFLSTKFINVSNSPKVMSPAKSNAAAAATTTADR